MEMTFSSPQMFGFVVRAILTIAFPFICMFITHKKFDGRFFPFVIGLVAVNLLVLPRALLRGMFVPDSGDFTIRLVLSSLIGAFCEETARFLMFRYMLKNYDTLTDAVCYGIGHHGMEVIPSVSFCFDAIATGSKLNSVGLEAMVAGVSVEEADALIKQIEIYTSIGFLEHADVVLSWIASLAMQIAWSVLVFTAAYKQDYRKFYFAALLLHIVANVLIYGTIMNIIGATAMCYFAYRVAKSSELPVTHSEYYD